MRIYTVSRYSNTHGTNLGTNISSIEVVPFPTLLLENDSSEYMIHAPSFRLWPDATAIPSPIANGQYRPYLVVDRSNSDVL